MVYTFKFYVNNQLYFASRMKKQECIAKTKKGTQCRHIVNIGQPFCYQHITSSMNLKIKPSTLPNGGKGLFAWSPQTPFVFDKDDIICEYDGEFISRSTLDNRYGEYTAPYAIAIRTGNNPRYEDAALHRGIGSLANHNTPQYVNAKFVIKKLQRKNHSIYLKATRRILHGEEIFVDYGLDYLFYEPTKHTESGNPLRYDYNQGDKVGLKTRNNVLHYNP